MLVEGGNNLSAVLVPALISDMVDATHLVDVHGVSFGMDLKRFGWRLGNLWPASVAVLRRSACLSASLRCRVMLEEFLSSDALFEMIEDGPILFEIDFSLYIINEVALAGFFITKDIHAEAWSSEVSNVQPFSSALLSAFRNEDQNDLNILEVDGRRVYNNG